MEGIAEGVEVSDDTCVYLHRRLDDGLIFYVGIGKGNRAFKYGRNEWWRRTADKHGLKVEVIEQGLTWEQACAIERELIATFRSPEWVGWAKLTNLTDGGDGTKGWNLHNPQGAKSAAEHAKKLASQIWSDPEFRSSHVRRLADASKRNWESPGYRNLMSEASKRTWEDPEMRKKLIEARRRNWENPEFRKAVVENSKRNWEDPELRKVMTEAIVDRWKDPSYRQKFSLAQRIGESGYRGVVKRANLWSARQKVNGHRHYIGEYPDPLRAAWARELFLFKMGYKLTALNFPEWWSTHTEDGDDYDTLREDVMDSVDLPPA